MGNISSTERREAMHRAIDIHNRDGRSDLKMPPHYKNASRQEYLDEAMKNVWNANARNINDDGPGAFNACTKAAIYYKKANDKK